MVWGGVWGGTWYGVVCGISDRLSVLPDLVEQTKPSEDQHCVAQPQRVGRQRAHSGETKFHRIEEEQDGREGEKEHGDDVLPPQEHCQRPSQYGETQAADPLGIASVPKTPQPKQPESLVSELLVLALRFRRRRRRRIVASGGVGGEVL